MTRTRYSCLRVRLVLVFYQLANTNPIISRGGRPPRARRNQGNRASLNPAREPVRGVPRNLSTSWRRIGYHPDMRITTRSARSARASNRSASTAPGNSSVRSRRLLARSVRGSRKGTLCHPSSCVCLIVSARYSRNASSVLTVIYWE